MDYPEGKSLSALPLESSDEQRQQRYQILKEKILLLIAGERNLVAVLATLACELHNAFDFFSWTVSARDSQPPAEFIEFRRSREVRQLEKCEQAVVKGLR